MQPDSNSGTKSVRRFIDRSSFNFKHTQLFKSKYSKRSQPNGSTDATQRFSIGSINFEPAIYSDSAMNHSPICGSHFQLELCESSRTPVWECLRVISLAYNVDAQSWKHLSQRLNIEIEHWNWNQYHRFNTIIVLKFAELFKNNKQIKSVGLLRFILKFKIQTAQVRKTGSGGLTPFRNSYEFSMWKYFNKVTSYENRLKPFHGFVNSLNFGDWNNKETSSSFLFC